MASTNNYINTLKKVVDIEENYKTLDIIAKNDSDPPYTPIINCTKVFINFDKNNTFLSEKHKFLNKVDMLEFLDNTSLRFTEFKAGKPENVKYKDLASKLIDSIIICNDIVVSNDFLWQNFLTYIIVMNPPKDINDKIRFRQKNKIPIDQELAKYEGFLYKTKHVYSFEEYVDKILKPQSVYAEFNPPHS